VKKIDTMHSGHYLRKRLLGLANSLDPLPKVGSIQHLVNSRVALENAIAVRELSESEWKKTLERAHKKTDKSWGDLDYYCNAYKDSMECDPKLVTEVLEYFGYNKTFKRDEKDTK